MRSVPLLPLSHTEPRQAHHQRTEEKAPLLSVRPPLIYFFFLYDIHRSLHGGNGKWMKTFCPFPLPPEAAGGRGRLRGTIIIISWHSESEWW